MGIYHLLLALSLLSFFAAASLSPFLLSIPGYLNLEFPVPALKRLFSGMGTLAPERGWEWEDLPNFAVGSFFSVFLQPREIP